MTRLRTIVLVFIFLAAFGPPAAASALTPASPNGSVSTLKYVPTAFIQAEARVGFESQQGCAPTYDDLASESLLAAKGGAHWGNPKILARHFRDHGADFGAKSADEYAQQASDFLRRSQAEGLPTKTDADGVIRVFDPKSNPFGAYNPDGTTRTFFKPSSPTYWDRQPGSTPWTPK